MIKILLLSFFSIQAGATVIRNEMDFASYRFNVVLEVSQSLKPTEIRSKQGKDGQYQVESYLVKNEQSSKIEPLPFVMPTEKCASGQTQKVKAALSNSYFQIEQSSVYEISADVQCGMITKLYFDAPSAEGQAVTIWQVASTAVKKFKEIDRLNFWNQQITFVWPSKGDYYTYDQVHITKGHHWDVVGHELGHAIYDQASIGSFDGGAHKIDECYTQTMALSEGWASYFAAWLIIALNDSDAKFEFIVPRRAPIRIEHIPADVCAGPLNEWRVIGWFWDLVDLHSDNENVNHQFLKVWDNTLNKYYSKTSDFAYDFMSNGFDQNDIRTTWKLNFLEPLN